MNNYFFAIELNDEVKENLHNVVESLKKIQNRGINYVDKDLYHITLLFLGKIDVDLITELYDEIDNIRLKTEDINIDKLGFFPHSRSPRVLWAGSTSMNNYIYLLNHAIYSIVSRKIKVDNSKFHLHITLARIKDFLNEKFVKFVEDYNFSEKILINTDSFLLLKSETINNRTVYKVIRRFKIENNF